MCHGWKTRARSTASRARKRIEPPSLQYSRLKTRRLANVLAWFDSRISIGLIEGINSLVQAAKTKARGYRNGATLKVVTYMIASKLNLRLPT